MKTGIFSQLDDELVQETRIGVIRIIRDGQIPQKALALKAYDRAGGLFRL